MTSDRFTCENGLRITVQVPQSRSAALTEAILKCDPLAYGDYDEVTFQSAQGTQSFRSTGTGRNPATKAAVNVPCVELSFFVSAKGGNASAVLEALYSAHPYEEPVIFITPCMRTRHIRGMDEDNPARFWNAPVEDWVPAEHR